VRRVSLLYYVARALPWRSILKRHDRRAPLVLWIHHRYPDSLLTYIAREDTIVKDVGLITALCERGVPFRLVFGRRIDAVSDHDVVYTIHPYNPDRVHDYAAGLLIGLERIAARGNRLLPTAAEAQWWENKVYMHRRFDELGIHCPTTEIVALAGPLDVAAFTYPVLAKEPHSSGSRGVHKVSSAGELQRLADQLAADGETELLIQQLIDMRRDFRATLVGDQIVHSYFRINTSAEWQPTSTKHGSLVDFESFPEAWRGYIVDVFGQLGLHSGAFDLCWAGDDLTSEPYVLEVSPAYTPNPPPPEGWTDPYYVFKSELFGPNAYAKAKIATVTAIARQLIEVYGLVPSTEG
jgi:hypothetical protein